MKKILYISLVLALASCAREHFDPQPLETNVLRASLVREKGTLTKTQTLDNPGIRMETRWVDGDQIGVWGSESGDNVLYEVEPADISYGGRSALFYGKENIPKGKLTAVYPYQENAVLSGESIQVSFPPRQVFTRNNSVPAPDPAAMILAAHGNGEDGLQFYGAVSMLKIGYTAPENQVIKEVIFTDLAGGPVNGTLTVAWEGGLPKPSVDGGTSSILLDCGNGVLATGEDLTLFWMSVPARHYPQGIGITFVLKDGTRLEKTIGTAYGKTLYRGVVHAVGDARTVEEYTGSGVSYELKDNVVVVDRDKVDLLRDVQRKNVWYTSETGEEILMDALQVMVHKDLGLAKGTYMILNEVSELLPYGFIGVVEEYTAFGDEAQALIRACEDPAEPFKHLRLGSPIYSDDGSILDGGGLDLNLGGRLESVITPDGEDLPFDVEGDSLTLYEPPTKAVKNSSYTSPRLKFSVKAEGTVDSEISLGVQLQLNTRFSMGADDEGKTEYIHFNLNPKVLFDLQAKYSLSHDIETLSGSMEFGTFRFAPITVGVIIVRPSVELGAYGKARTSVELNVKYSYVYDAGTFGFSYSRAQGFSPRQLMTQPSEEDGIQPPEVTLNGTLSMSVGLYATPELSLYGLLAARLRTQVGLQFAIGYDRTTDGNDFVGGGYFSITPEFSLTPSLATLGGWWNKKMDELEPLEFDPIFKKYLIPEYKYGASVFEGIAANPVYGDRVFLKYDDKSYDIKKITGYDGFDYHFVFRQEPLMTLGVGVALYGGEKFDYLEPSASQTELINLGLEDYTSFNRTVLVKAKYLGAIQVGEYSGPESEDQETVEYKGTIHYPFDFDDYKYYMLVPCVFVPGHPKNDLMHYNFGSVDKWGGTHTAFCCHWPRLSNGQQWPYDREVPYNGH